MVVLYILLAILILGVLIFVHELGHFLFAKTFRVPVETFALGFGPSLVSFKRKETTLPLKYFSPGWICQDRRYGSRRGGSSITVTISNAGGAVFLSLPGECYSIWSLLGC